MLIKSLVNSVFNSIEYKYGSVLLDPGDDWIDFRTTSTVLLTHAHFDHIYGLNRVIELNPDVRVYTNESGRGMLLNARKNLSFYHESPFEIFDPTRIVVVNDRNEIYLTNGMMAKAIFTPGHNPSCITWQIEDALFTGDSFIPGIMTVTNLPGGNKLQAEESIALIKRLAIGRTIYPGHLVNQM